MVYVKADIIFKTCRDEKTTIPTNNNDSKKIRLSVAGIGIFKRKNRLRKMKKIDNRVKIKTIILTKKDVIAKALDSKGFTLKSNTASKPLDSSKDEIKLKFNICLS